MPGLFDALKDGTFSLFAGPQDPRLPKHTGGREALMAAGLGTIASGNQDPLEALAIGIQQGQAAGAAAQERQLGLQQQAALGSFIQQAGYDREGLTSVFFKVLASGDMEGARAISEILKSLPKESERPLSFSTDDVINPETGVTESVRVGLDPMTGQEVSRTVIGRPPPPPDAFIDKFDEPNAESPTGAFRVGIRRDGGREILGLAAPSGGGTGGAQGRINTNLAAAMKNAEDTLSTVDDELARPIVSILGGFARQGGIIGTLANGALAAVSPDGQLAMAAADQWTAATVRLLSGAQMTEVERQGYRSAYLPAGNDTVTVQRQKAAARGALAALFAASDAPPTAADLDQVLEGAGLAPVGAGGGGGVDADTEARRAAARERLRGGR